MQAQSGPTWLRLQMRVRLLRETSLCRGAQMLVRLLIAATNETGKGEPLGPSRQSEQDLRKTTSHTTIS